MAESVLASSKMKVTPLEFITKGTLALTWILLNRVVGSEITIVRQRSEGMSVTMIGVVSGMVVMNSWHGRRRGGTNQGQGRDHTLQILVVNCARSPVKVQISIKNITKSALNNSFTFQSSYSSKRQHCMSTLLNSQFIDTVNYDRR
jgi:hypothetical protein